jgi:hypothetical protein
VTANYDDLDDEETVDSFTSDSEEQDLQTFIASTRNMLYQGVQIRFIYRSGCILQSEKNLVGTSLSHNSHKWSTTKH